MAFDKEAYWEQKGQPKQKRMVASILLCGACKARVGTFEKVNGTLVHVGCPGAAKPTPAPKADDLKNHPFCTVSPDAKPCPMLMAHNGDGSPTLGCTCARAPVSRDPERRGCPPDCQGCSCHLAPPCGHCTEHIPEE